MSAWRPMREDALPSWSDTIIPTLLYAAVSFVLGMIVVKALGLKSNCMVWWWTGGSCLGFNSMLWIPAMRKRAEVRKDWQQRESQEQEARRRRLFMEYVASTINDRMNKLSVDSQLYMADLYGQRVWPGHHICVLNLDVLQDRAKLRQFPAFVRRTIACKLWGFNGKTRLAGVLVAFRGSDEHPLSQDSAVMCIGGKSWDRAMTGGAGRLLLETPIIDILAATKICDEIDLPYESLGLARDYYRNR